MLTYVGGLFGYTKRSVKKNATRHLSAPRDQRTEETATESEYTLKASPWSSHGRILSWLGDRAPRRVLDLGCSSGLLAAAVSQMGVEVTGVDATEFPEAAARMHRFVRANLDEGVPATVGSGYDVLIAGDVLEHVRFPELILGQIDDLLAPGGRAFISIPNFSHWYPRIRVLSGTFDYDDRGILDRGHVRFFTRRSFERLVRGAGLRIVRTESIGIPIERVADSGSPLMHWLSRVDRFAANTYPSLFAYQYLFEVVPEDERLGA